MKEAELDKVESEKEEMTILMMLGDTLKENLSLLIKVSIVLAAAA